MKGSDERPIPSTVAEAAGHASPAEVARRYTTVGVDYADATRPAGYNQIARFRGGEVWTGHGESKRDEVVVVALPHPGDDPEAHNCDAMGCGTDHVIARVALRPRPDGDQVAAFVDSHAKRLAEEDGENWEDLDGEGRDSWASDVHHVLNQLKVGNEGQVLDGRPERVAHEQALRDELAAAEAERDRLAGLNEELAAHCREREEAAAALEADLAKALALSAKVTERDRRRRLLLDGVEPAVGQRVVTDLAACTAHHLAHAHSDHVHVITSLLGGDTCLVECGPQQIAVGHLRLAPAGAEVTCSACRGWPEQLHKWRIDAEAYRATDKARAEKAAADQALLEARAQFDAARADALRYRRLRVLGAAPGGSLHLEDGNVLCFTNLDTYVDTDIAAHPSRGEATGG